MQVEPIPTAKDGVVFHNNSDHVSLNGISCQIELLKKNISNGLGALQRHVSHDGSFN